MKIDIIGAGAIGLLFASKLKLAGHDVRIWCKSKEQMEYIQTSGILFEDRVAKTNNTQVNIEQVAVFDLEHLSQFQNKDVDFTIVALKQNSINDSFLTLLKLHYETNINSLYLFMQNGIGHLQKVMTVLDEQSVVQSITSEAALKIEQGVAHTGYGMTYLAEHENRTEKTKKIEECLNNAGIQSLVSKRINEYAFNKLIINAVINPLTALFNVKNGELPLHEARKTLMDMLFKEAKQVLEHAYHMTLSITFDDILLICDKTSLNHSSMLADILKGKPTEIDAINGAIVKLAEKHHVQAPINKTVTLLILAKHP